MYTVVYTHRYLGTQAILSSCPALSRVHKLSTQSSSPGPGPGGL